MGEIRKKISPILIAALVLVLGLLSTKLFVGFNNLMGDLLLETKGVNSDIVIVSIDDISIGKIGQWPWPRATYAEVINKLNSHPPKVLGIDVLFAEESRLGGATDDNKLARALSGAKYKIILASRESDGVKPLQKFANPNTTFAEVGLIVDPDGIVRRARGANFSEQLAGVEATQGSPERIVWSGKVGTFRRIPFYRLLEAPELAQELENKIVIIGSTATDLHDEQQTAIERGIAMPGVEIQANLTNMYLSNYKYKDVNSTRFALLLALAALVPLICFALFSGVYLPLFGAIVGFVIFVIGIVVAWQNDVAVDMLYPLLVYILSTVSQLLYRYFGSERSRKELRKIFGKYVSGAVLEEILRDPSNVGLGGQEKEATILFSDIRGFTSLSETMSPSELVQFLNRYLSRMTDIVIRHNGVIDKYIGDAIMAFWGAPLKSNSHAKDAVLAAAAMSDGLSALNEENRRLGIREIEIGIGIHTGMVVAGNVGSESRFDYTVMGDTVNLSSRLESLTKNYGVRILASEETIQASDREKLTQIGLSFREIDQVKVKGKQRPTRIFEIIPATRKADYDKIASRFSGALEYYYKGDWDKTLRLIAEIDSIVPNDGPSKTLRERCLNFKVVPPTNWEGVYEHKSK